MTEDYEAIVRVEVRNGERALALDVVVDTGFSEFLMLPSSVLQRLGAVVEDETRVVLGDGSIVLLDAHVVEVRWQGGWQAVRTLASEGDALVGMKLLEGQDLFVRVAPNGEMRILPY